MSAPNNNRDDSEGFEIVEEAMMDALAAKETMFKEIPVADGNSMDATIVHKRNFSVSEEEIGMTTGGKGNQLGERSYEYGASWVENYYSSLITLCKQRDRMEIVKMLYHWYIAQFTVDYINDVAVISKEQYLSTSNVVSTSENNGAESNEAIRKHHFDIQLQACKNLMEEHDKALSSLPAITAKKISEALHDFYAAVAQQCNVQTKVDRTEDYNHPFASMSMAEYMDYRTINAGGLMGFLRQTYLISMLDTSGSCTFPSSDEIRHISYLVGKNVALVNDLYGLRKDSFLGEPNIILKHAWEIGCSYGGSSDFDSFSASLAPSISWASDEIEKTVQDIESYYEDHPDCIFTKRNVAFGCILGNHGFHESSKRYELPVGFSWTREENRRCLITV